MHEKDLLEKLLESGHSEAVKLNEDYNQLLKNLTNAQEAIETFKKEKLGMSGEKDIIE